MQNPASGTILLLVYLQGNYHSSFEQVQTLYLPHWACGDSTTVSQARVHSATPQIPQLLTS